MIGIFDSGVGGVTVARAIRQRLPEYQLLYLGDSARAPYGNRSQQLIYQFTAQALDFLFGQGCQLVIIACNTASAEALRKIQQEYLPKKYPDRRVLGVIRPVVEVVVEQSKTGRIGVVGTRGTVSSGAFEREIKTARSDATVFQQACPLLVPLVEEGWQQRPETMRIIRQYVRSLKQQRIDTLILGCTHYPMLEKQFRSAMGRRVVILDSPKIVAEKLADYLQRHPEIEKKLTRGANHRFVVTDITQPLERNTQQWLGEKIVLQKIMLST
ncbi:MAG: glutamate racemase [Candidatus Buchananbacteria bacterium RIFCSPHIGHO2_01_FULL_47_11b]|uniref:Glutamate racemase n=1 Tax=Candidatus Buchananbacteria bacterium RIFCSPHIGHO2_01_FULL_47_11b TaxID=1797537 RepID=A0A1G1Y5Q8_9BACT|nr:MAG: glutamate racemase [Candidatus Buchananbacteria bacterium RIFCSPHIGHO2_01_FULL_47_11b]